MKEQRKRMVGSLMQYIEANVYPKLTPAERKALRDKVLSSTIPYHDVCLDVLNASVNDGMAINEEAVRLMGEISTRLQQQDRHG